MRKRILSGILIFCMLICMSFNVLAQEEESLRYESDLPIEFTAETTVEEIQNDIAGYITWANLSIVYDSDEYVDLMYDFVFYNKLDVNEVTARYYSAYASIYLAEEDMSLQMGKTIQQVKDDTMLEQSEMEQYYADAPEDVQILHRRFWLLVDFNRIVRGTIKRQLNQQPGIHG